MRAILSSIRAAFSNVYSGWILWNLFLAFIPLALSFWLYRQKTESRSLLWWLGFLVYAAFLPNAPYVLTDIIHLIRGTPYVSTWLIALVFLPIHAFAILLGFEAYVVALINQGYYLKQQGAKQFILPAELLTHVLCAIGIYMGRFRRFNSWDLVTDPDNVLITTLDDLTSKWPLAVIVTTFVILTVLYWLLKQITLGLVLRVQYARLGKDVLDEI
ncbi:DUF1361 domain-containing protein [Thermocoleostomius sinensis]|jgi:uncharacterized membrane protein|uniref:DUF1361 domain-containing protein n=1 Tax=Thermocoleostomius sinensis A174 TaxID=2016057 RepID=A0A9E8ZG70_9CYAN|nr:DUF1361 domain-containing protein [Thermocoleostomius sinensis]WAL62548.1 DUF1361 domain-containing protein [Thermocoleostomius sinensis A174]